MSKFELDIQKATNRGRNKAKSGTYIIRTVWIRHCDCWREMLRRVTRMSQSNLDIDKRTESAELKGKSAHCQVFFTAPRCNMAEIAIWKWALVPLLQQLII